MKTIVVFLTLMLASFAQAQPRNDRPDLTPGQAQDLRQWNREDHRPRWCRMYDRGDYHRELRTCGDDRYCRRDVRRKAERCGLR